MNYSERLNGLNSNFQVSHFRSVCSLFFICCKPVFQGRKDWWQLRVSFVLFIIFKIILPRSNTRECDMRSLWIPSCSIGPRDFISHSLGDPQREVCFFLSPGHQVMAHFLLISLNLKHVTCDQVSSVVIKVVIKDPLRCWGSIPLAS